MSIGMFESFMTSYWFSPEAKRIWSDTSTLQAWLDVEAALARAQGELGLIPETAAMTIAANADGSRFDLIALERDIAFAQHPLVPVLHRFEALCGEDAARYIHWGATTQNVLDAATALQMARTHRLVLQSLDSALTCLSTLALAHKDTPMAGRTHGQHALPMTFGFKVAGWIDEIDRQRCRLHERFYEAFTVPMGGAIGTFGAMGRVGPQVEARVAELLGLRPSTLPMRSSYDRVADYCCVLGMLAATIQKLGEDVVFLQRTEVAEVAEAFHMGKIGSSTMAQKRNPATAMLLMCLARLLRGRIPMVLETMVRMDEGDASATDVTDVLSPEIGVLSLSIAELLAKLAGGLVVDAAAMRRNLALSGGMIASEAAMMGLARDMGRHEAHRVLYEAAQQAQSDRRPYLEVIRAHAAFKDRPAPTELERWLDPEKGVGESIGLTESVVARVRARLERDRVS